MNLKQENSAPTGQKRPPKKYVYRGSQSSDSPFNTPSYALWSADPDKAFGFAGHDRSRFWRMDVSGAVTVDDLHDDLALALEDAVENGTTSGRLQEMIDFVQRDVDEGRLKGTVVDHLLTAFDPPDITEHAEAFDLPEVVQWFWDTIADPKGIEIVATRCGAVSFSADHAENVGKLSEEEFDALWSLKALS